MFTDSQRFSGINDFSILIIKNVPNTIKYHNLVPNQEAQLCAIQQRKLQALVWWAKD